MKKAPLITKGQSFYFVGAARFELATSTSQMWRDNRATLRPELWLSISKLLEPFKLVEPTCCCGEGGSRTHGTV